ncbi:MAG: GAF domain-containing protein [Anaerolineaceae bacterium]|nr:GAF domain-containing protein [Anaerolineaceae bacterium]
MDDKQFAIIAIHDSTKSLGAEYSLQRKNNELLTINRVSQAVSSSLSLGEVLSSILEETKTIFETRFSSIWLLDDAKNEFVCVNASGTNASLKIGMRNNESCKIFKKILNEKVPVIIEDIRNAPDENQIENIDHGFEVRTLLALPILFQGQTIGVMQFLDDRENFLNKGDIEILMSIAANSAVAITHARQFERMAGDQQRWRTLQLISQKINACLQSKEIFRAIATNIIDILTFDYFVVGLLDENLVDYEIVHLVDHFEEQQTDNTMIGEGLFRNVINSGRTLLIDNYTSAHHGKIDIEELSTASHETHSIMAVPVVRNGKIIGILSMINEESSMYGAADIQMLELIAAHTVVALDNAHHYQEVLESARLRDTIYLMGQEINTRLNPDQVYETLFRTIEKVIPFDLMFISTVEQNQATHVLQYMHDKSQDKLFSPLSIPSDEGLSARVIKSGKTFRCNDAKLRQE